MNSAVRVWPQPPSDGEVQKLWLRDVRELELLEQKGATLMGKVELHITFRNRNRHLLPGVPSVVRALIGAAIIENAGQIEKATVEYGDVPLGVKVEVKEI